MELLGGSQQRTHTKQVNQMLLFALHLLLLDTKTWDAATQQREVIPGMGLGALEALLDSIPLEP